jgi:phage recombination protein Bet
MSNAVAIKKDITPEVWNTLKNSIYPGASDAAVHMVLDYCRAQNLDPLLKPVHIVPMQGKDVVMPGIGFYRIQASRSEKYAGMTEPEYGPVIVEEWNGKYGPVKVKYPEWCKITVNKLLGDKIIAFTAIEYWKENYASQGAKDAPNTMWAKRPYAQLAKCAEAQALRKAFPEITGGMVTAEEMEGKSFDMPKDVTPKKEEHPRTKPDVSELFLIDGKMVSPVELHMLISSKIEMLELPDDIADYEAWKDANKQGIMDFAKKHRDMCAGYADAFNQRKEEILAYRESAE